MSLKGRQKIIKSSREFTDLEKRYAAKLVDAQVIAEVVALWTGVPVTKITQEESEKLLKMEEALAKKLLVKVKPSMQLFAQ